MTLIGSQLVVQQQARYKAGEKLFYSTENLYCRFSNVLHYARLNGVWWEQIPNWSWKKTSGLGYDLDNIRVWSDTVISRLTIITPQELSEVVASQLLQ